MIITGSIVAQKSLVDDLEVSEVSKVQLPKVEHPTSEIKGAGIAGSLEMPIVGLINAMELQIELRSPNKETGKVLKGGERKIEIRHAAQNGSSIKVFATGIVKSYDPGSGEVSCQMNGSVTFSVLRYRQVCDGIETLLIDQRNYIYKVDGVDYLEKVRAAL